MTVSKFRRACILGLFALSACGGSDDAAPEEHAEGEEEHVEDTAVEGRVTLGAPAMKTAEILVEPALSENAGQAASGLEVPGEVHFDPRRVAVISPRTDGRVERLLFVQGDRVRAGQPVAMIFTPTFISAQTEYLLARRRASALASTPDSAGALALVDAAAMRLRVLGVPAELIARLGSTQQVAELLPIYAPFSGSILEMNALPGAAVSAGSPIFKIADLSFVDVVAAVPERALPLVHTGDRASVYLAAYPGLDFSGTVERMEQQLDETTRTVGAVIHVQNSNQRLMPGMFATVRLHIAVSTGAPNSAQQIITIAETAVVNEGTERFVFVEIQPGTFEKRIVDVASLEAPGASHPLTNRVVVKSGLKAGERVVVRGAFTLKSELGKASLGDHGH